MNEPARILVVDDTPASRSFLVRLLRSAGYEVQSSDNGEEGLTMAIASAPDLVLLDVRMKEMSGLEVCRQLRTRAETQDVPIILVSAFAELDERIDGLQLGASDYVSKPFQISELLARVRTQLALGRTLALLKEKSAVIERTNQQLQAEIDARLKTEEELLRSLDRAERARRALLSALEDEKEVQGALRHARAFLDLVIENIPNMVFIKDASELRFARINRAGEELLGIPRTELLGKTDHEFFPRSHADFYVAKDREVLQQRAVVDIPEEPVQTRDNGERILHTKKVPILGAEGRPEYVLGVSVDITESKRAQDAIANLTARLESILAAVPEIIMEVDTDRFYRWANQAGISFFGEDVIGKPADHYFVGEQETYRSVEPIFDGREDAIYVESLQRRRDGAHRLLAWWCRPLKDASGMLIGALSSARDITESRRMEEERRRLEEQVRVSQKMEAIGSLAGGVAHDFNNLLCVLQSYAEFAIRGVRHDDPVKEDLLAVKRAGERAATLTRQLLAFGRRQVLQPVPLNLNDVAQSMEKMLRRILGEDVEYLQVLAPDLGVVRADQGQLEQVFMNLVVNARDAMPEGGRLTIATRNVEITASSQPAGAPLHPGAYVEISVTDTGCGMDELTMGRVFEPFFTTKEKGKGTGLGLATVYGIVKQSKGGIEVESEVGKGTTFRIYLPREVSAVPVVARAQLSQDTTDGTETVLVVEDEEDLRNVTKRALEAAGYTVLCAADGEEALLVAERHPGDIHLLLTDVVMPRMGGRALAKKLKHRRPKTAVLYMTGYTDDAIIRHELLDAGTHLLAKPFTGNALTQKVRGILDASSPGGASGKKNPRKETESAMSGSQALALESIPEDLLREICVAAMTARQDELVANIGRLRPVAPALAEELLQQADCFDYEAVMNTLSRRKTGGTT